MTARTKVVGGMSFAVTLAVFALSVITVSHFSTTELTKLLILIVVSAIAGRIDLRLPKTRVNVPIGHLIAVWSVLWLGVSGGILLGAAASISHSFFRKRPLSMLVFTFSKTVVSLAIGAQLFLYVLTPDQASTYPAIWVAAGGAIFISVVGTIVYFGLDLIGGRYATNNDGRILVRDLLGAMLGLISANGAAAITYLLVVRFGLDIVLLLTPAAIISFVAYRFHVARLEQKTSLILEASRIHMATVEALATAIDARDQVGHGHVRRTQIYAVRLGQSLGLSENDIDALRTGALLHDIGKLAVPDHILSKAATLTAAEMEKTKIHSMVGASILEKVGFQSPVLPTILHHHEWWDGSGYPEGFSGVDIPLTARVLTIADAFDTLRSDRPFRAAVTREQARDHLLELSGSQFDPALVRVFLKNLTAYEAEIDAQGLSYTAVLTDIHSSVDNPHRSYVDQIKLANKEVFTLFELAREFGSAENLDDVLALFTEKIRQLIPFSTCVVYLLDDLGRTANACHVEGENSELLGNLRIKIGEGATGFVLKKRQMVKNVNPDLDFSISHLNIIQQYSTMASLPLIVEDVLIGAVSIYSIDLPSYCDEHLRLLETISRIAAEAIEKSLQHAQAMAYALTDAMTGLPNARSLQKHFDKEVGRADRTGKGFQLVVLDLDRFKAVNDNFGHKVGDEMLREVGSVISGQLREYDFLSRYGGDEFVAIIPEATQNDVVELCSRIEAAVAEFQLPVGDDDHASVGVSLGAAGYPYNGRSFDKLIVAADKAMYRRKSSRKQPAVPRRVPTPPISEIIGQDPRPIEPSFEFAMPPGDGFIVELDESHVIASAAIN